MSASRAPYLNDWRFSMTLVPKNLTQDCQDPGKTFRGPNARVENGLGRNCNDSNTAFNRGGTAKPGPTTDTSSRIARIKKLQTRTKTKAGRQTIGGTQRGAHATVENGSTGADPRSLRAQLFGNYGEVIPGQTSGRGGDSSQVTYFKNVFDRVSLNTVSSGTAQGDN
tara:strand:+ start:1298 stop:1798 length:501 start_codon:yes stop_codon:yes gene_type:complete